MRTYGPRIDAMKDQCQWGEGDSLEVEDDTLAVQAVGSIVRTTRMTLQFQA